LNIYNKEELILKGVYDQNIYYESNESNKIKKVRKKDFGTLEYSPQKGFETSRSPSCFSNINLKCEVIKRKIILLADDNHIINNSNKRLLMQIFKEIQIDYEIICCSDGMDILKYIMDDKTFDNVCIITDENMEYLNGSEAINIIRTIEERKVNSRKLIISLTCYEDISMINYIMKSGADTVLTKPLNKNKIKQIFIRQINSSLV